MSLQLLEDSLDFLCSLGLKETILIGGEPTIYPHIHEAITGCLARGIEPILITNGRRLADHRFVDSLRQAGLKRVSISIESLSAIDHDTITQRSGSFAETWAGLANVVKQGFDVSSATTISMDNAGKVVNMLNSLCDVGVGTVGFNIVTPNIDDTSGVNHGLRLDETVSVMQNLLIAAEGKAKIHYAASIPLCLTDCQFENDEHFRGSCCIFDGSGIVIDADGKILPCVHWIGAEISSIYDSNGKRRSADNFLEEWNSGIPLQFRQEIFKYPSEHCIDCSRWANGSCTGGCPLLRLNQDVASQIAQRKGGVRK